MTTAPASMALRNARNRNPLRTALLLDAAVTGANAVAYLAAAGPLEDLLGIDAGLLRGVGVFLAVFAVVVARVARVARVGSASARGARVVIAANVVWAVDSLVVAAAGWGSPTGVGRAWIVLQAVAVAGFAVAQAWAVRRARHA